MSRAKKITKEQSQVVFDKVGPDLKDRQLILSELAAMGLTENQVISRLEKFVSQGKLLKIKTLHDGRIVRYRWKVLDIC